MQGFVFQATPTGNPSPQDKAHFSKCIVCNGLLDDGEIRLGEMRTRQAHYAWMHPQCTPKATVDLINSTDASLNSVEGFTQLTLATRNQYFILINPSSILHVFNETSRGPHRTGRQYPPNSTNAELEKVKKGDVVEQVRMDKKVAKKLERKEVLNTSYQ
jgi:hypothetical protein